jgi:hypothetical protein
MSFGPNLAFLFAENSEGRDLAFLFEKVFSGS